MYSSKYDRWYPIISMPESYSYQWLDFDDYMYIIGDKVYKESSPEAREAFERVKVWMQLKA